MTELKRVTLPASGYLQLNEFISIPGKQIGFVPVSKAAWYHWVSTGYAPQGKKLGSKKRMWNVDQLREFMAKVEAQ